MTSKRDPLDRYYTPDWAAKAAVDRLDAGGIISPYGKFWEPHAGSGAFIDALGTRSVVGTDIMPARSDIHLRDALDGPPDGYLPDVVIGNPPFFAAEEHIRSFCALPSVHVVAMLLRVGFLGAQKRAEFWRRYPLRALFVFGRRPSFTGKGTDSHDYAVMVWTPRQRGPQIIGRIDD